MYPERDDGTVRGNIRSSRAISLRFLVSDIKSIEFSPLPFSFSFFKSTKTRLLRIGKLFFKSFSLDRLLALKRNRVREEENEKKATRNGWIETREKQQWTRGEVLTDRYTRIRNFLVSSRYCANPEDRDFVFGYLDTIRLEMLRGLETKKAELKRGDRSFACRTGKLPRTGNREELDC